MLVDGCCQGALLGSLCGMLVNTWISVGRISVNIQYTTLPLGPVDRCYAAVANDSFSLLWQPVDVTTAAAATDASHRYDVTRDVTQVRAPWPRSQRDLTSKRKCNWTSGMTRSVNLKKKVEGP